MSTRVARGPVPTGVLGMAIFLATELMFFAGLVSAYLVLRAQAPGWPPFDQPRLPVGVTALNTGVLLASGITIQVAFAALRRRPQLAARWLWTTSALGAAFLAVQGGEWLRLLAYGLSTRGNLFGASFYTIVGAHGLHVAAALACLAWATLRARRPELDPDELEPVRMLWTFVVAVWPPLYLLVYF